MSNETTLFGSVLFGTLAFSSVRSQRALRIDYVIVDENIFLICSWFVTKRTAARTRKGKKTLSCLFTWTEFKLFVVRMTFWPFFFSTLLYVFYLLNKYRWKSFECCRPWRTETKHWIVFFHINFGRLWPEISRWITIFCQSSNCSWFLSGIWSNLVEIHQRFHFNENSLLRKVFFASFCRFFSAYKRMLLTLHWLEGIWMWFCIKNYGLIASAVNGFRSACNYSSESNWW